MFKKLFPTIGSNLIYYLNILYSYYFTNRHQTKNRTKNYPVAEKLCKFSSYPDFDNHNKIVDKHETVKMEIFILLEFLDFEKTSGQNSLLFICKSTSKF